MSESPRPAHPTLRGRLYLILDSGPGAGAAGALVDGVLMALIVANVLAVTAESVPRWDAAYGHLFDFFESISIGIFTIEYLLRLWVAPEDPRYAHAVLGRLRYAVTPLMVIDFLAFAPAYFTLLPFVDARILRVFRLLRLLKILRYSPAMMTLAQVISMERRALMGTLVLMLTVMCLSAQTMYMLEGDVQPAKFGTLPDAVVGDRDSVDRGVRRRRAAHRRRQDRRRRDHDHGARAVRAARRHRRHRVPSGNPPPRFLGELGNAGA